VSDKRFARASEPQGWFAFLTDPDSLEAVPELSETSNPAESPDFMLIGCYGGMSLAFERALVILAMGLACQIEKDPAGDGYVLLAEPGAGERIQEELAMYEHEQALPLRMEVTPVVEYDAGALPTALWVACLCAVFWLQRDHSALVALGASSAQGLIADGEWWRPFTALFLHADRMHLLSNVASGVLFGTWVCRSLGPWLGWALILSAGTLGNTLNAISRLDTSFTSLGASTAVFGALGILTGVAIFQVTRDRPGPKSFRYLVPLGGGLVLLSWLGVGSDPRTDVTGHVCGFAAGILLGVAAAWWRRGGVRAGG